MRQELKLMNKEQLSAIHFFNHPSRTSMQLEMYAHSHIGIQEREQESSTGSMLWTKDLTLHSICLESLLHSEIRHSFGRGITTRVSSLLGSVKNQMRFLFKATFKEVNS